jgi:5-methylthioadenosine/S-adenosylhomocysteine deaminase
MRIACLLGCTLLWGCTVDRELPGNDGAIPDGAVIDAPMTVIDAGPDAPAGDAGPPPMITPGAANRFLLQGMMLTPSGPLAGELLVENTLITCVAASCSGMAGATGATIIRTSGVISPGMIDTHNHGLFNIFDEGDWNPGMFYGDHDDWTLDARYKQVVDAKQYLGSEGTSPVDFRCEMDKYAEVKAMIAGTTSFTLAPGAIDLNCYASVIRTIDTSKNDLGVDKVRESTISIPDNAAATTLCNAFTADTVDAYVIHIGEGINATALNEFATLSSRAGGCLLAPQTAIVHGTALTPTEFATMAAAGMKLVWSPKSNLFLYDQTTRIDQAIAAGVQVIALAPDWSLGGSINLLDELRTADMVDTTKFGNILTPRRLFEMVTIDAAKVLAVDAVIGSLVVGKRADIAIYAINASDPYQGLLGAKPQTTELVMVDGRVLYGDSGLKAAGPAAPGCEDVSICGVPKFMCLAETDTTNKLNQTYAQIVQALTDGQTAYDAVVAPMGIAPFSPLAPVTKCN